MKDFTVSINLFMYYDNDMDEEKVREDIIYVLKAGLNHYSLCEEYDPIHEENVSVKRY